MKPVSLILLIALQLFSCRKEDIPLTGNERLSKIETLDASGQLISTAEYNYDSLGKLVKISAGPGVSVSVIQQFEYDASAKLKSYTVSNSTSGVQYKYVFDLDASGRIKRTTGTAFQPNFFLDDHVYTYDSKGQLIIDSAFSKSGSLNTFVNYQYDGNGNVVAYQAYVNNGTGLNSQGHWTMEYDSKGSPFSSIGQLLYTAAGSGNDYFYLSKNNPLKASLENTVMTPGGGFNYQYYNNSLLKTSEVKAANSLVQKYYYTN